MAGPVKYPNASYVRLDDKTHAKIATAAKEYQIKPAVIQRKIIEKNSDKKSIKEALHGIIQEKK